MTKAITGAAAMQQVERGKLGLDSPAKEVIPYLGEVEVLEGFDAAGKPRTRKPKRDITLRHLLTHTAGFSYEIWNADIIKYQQTMGVPGITGCENKALTTPLTFDPGERWDYGINIDWAGKMVEAASGQKLGQYLKDNLLGPLGMDSTAFFITPACASGWPASTIAAPTARSRPTWRWRSRSSRSSRWAAAGSTAPPATTRSSCA